jgi:uncharacterized protein
MATPKIDIPLEAVADFCRRNRICRLSLFGSVLRDDFTPESDIDILVEFEPGATPGLAFFTMQDELTVVFNRTVDLNTAGFLSKSFRDQVIAESEPVFVAA